MKNSTLIILLCLILNSFVSIAGDKKQNQQFHNADLSSGLNPSGNTFSFATFYSEDFSSGLPAGWQAIDSAGNGINWKPTTTGSFNGNDSLNATGTTAANGYMIIDSDSSGNSVGGENADLISDSIDCTGYSSVRLNFNEFLGHFNDTATVWVSNDGSTWTEVYNSSTGLAIYAATPNPHNVDIDISSVAANEATVYIRFNYRADYAYYWMIDDVQLYETPALDAAITGINAPITNCTLLSATEPVTVNIFNAGGGTIFGGLTVTFIADNGTPITETVNDSIIAGGNLVYTFTATVDFSVGGNHSLTTYVSLTGDTVQTNDTVSATVFSGPHVVNTSSTYSNGFETSDDLVGLITEDTNGDSITFEVSNILPNSGSQHMIFTGPTADDWFFTTCIQLDSAVVYKLKYFYRKTSSSAQVNLQILIGDIQSAGGMSQEIFQTTALNSLLYTEETVMFSVFLTNEYYIGFHITNADSIVGFALDDIYVGPDSGVGIEKINNSAFSLYPNPSNGKFRINTTDVSVKDFTIEVISQAGQLIYSRNANKMNNYEVDLHEQPAGMYFLRVISESGITTRKITITH